MENKVFWYRDLDEVRRDFRVESEKRLPALDELKAEVKKYPTSWAISPGRIMSDVSSAMID